MVLLQWFFIKFEGNIVRPIKGIANELPIRD